MSFPWDESRLAFGDAARWFMDVSRRVGDRWDRPALGEWEVRTLVGHTSRAMVTVETYLARPAGEVDIADPAGYFRAARSLSASPELMARAREAGAALGEDPAGRVAEIADRVIPLVDSCSGSELVTTIVGGMRLDDYLPTRTFELVVHTADLCAALGMSADVPATAASQAVHVIADLVVDDGHAAAVLFALTGRSELPLGLSLL